MSKQELKNKQWALRLIDKKIEKYTKYSDDKTRAEEHRAYWQGFVTSCNDMQDIIKELDEPKKVVVPKFVAEWIELCKGLECTLYCSATSKLRDTMHIEKAKEVSDWLDTFENHELFAHAWLDGYEVEKGPLYHVLLPDKGATNTGYTFLNLAGAIYFTTCKEKVDMLTEQEIKAIDERYWPFAVKVEYKK